MGSGWDYASSVAEKATTGGKYIKFEASGDKVVGAFVGDPHVDETYFNEATRRSEPFTETHAAEGKRPTVRFCFNFWVISENGSTCTPAMRVLQLNPKTFKQVLKNRDKYGLETWYFEIERNGAKGDTATVYTVLPEEKIPDDVRQKLTKALSAHQRFIADGTPVPEGIIPLNQLARVPSDAPPKVAREAAPAGAADSSATKSMDEIKVRLKQQPRAELEKFLAHFGVQFIKDLRSTDVSAALSYLANLEGRSNGTPVSSAGADPFAD